MTGARDARPAGAHRRNRRRRARRRYVARARHDEVVGEEPLELRLSAGGTTRTLAITMRTPGNDFELAAGFVFGEGDRARARRDRAIDYCLDPADRSRSALQHRQRRAARGASAGFRALRAALHDEQRVRRLRTRAARLAARSRRRCRSTTTCGVPASLLYALPARMREAQRIFAATGGLHAAALFDERGDARRRARRRRPSQRRRQARRLGTAQRHTCRCALRC